MKIALLTFHDTANFGSLLQTFGLYRTLREMGFACEVLDYQCEAIRRREIPCLLPRPESFRGAVSSIVSAPILRKRYRKLSDFLKNNMEISRRYDRKNIKAAEAEYDAFLVGSDMLWGFDITGGDPTYLLDFVTDSKKKFAFSTSIGTPWNEEEKKTVRPLLNNFQHISVRESHTIPWMRAVTKLPVRAVCDPTMLVSGDVWLTMAQKSKKDQSLKNAKYVLTYFAENQILRLDAGTYADRHKIKVYSIRYGLPKKGIHGVRPLLLEDFLCLIKNAQAVFTASYHGMLFALYFERELFYYNLRHPTRFNSVAEKLEITDRCGDGKKMFPEQKMDYAKINKRITAWREESLNILREYWKG